MDARRCCSSLKEKEPEEREKRRKPEELLTLNTTFWDITKIERILASGEHLFHAQVADAGACIHAALWTLPLCLTLAPSNDGVRLAATTATPGLSFSSAFFMIRLYLLCSYCVLGI
jgi:hypothetical protein